MSVASVGAYRCIKVMVYLVTRGCGRRLCDNAFYFRIRVVQLASTPSKYQPLQGIWSSLEP